MRPPFLLGMYSRTMAEVAFVNEFLRQSSPENIESRGHTNAVGNDIAAYRAEARLLRALAYYHLMDLFGKAPFVTENDAIGTAGPEYNRQQLFTYIETSQAMDMVLLILSFIFLELAAIRIYLRVYLGPYQDEHGVIAFRSS